MKVRAAFYNLTKEQAVALSLRCPKLMETVKVKDRYAVVFFQSNLILFDRITLDKTKKL